MKIDLTSLKWQLSGHTPTSWKMGRTMELAIEWIPEIAPVATRVPGSVQGALFEAGVLPDWTKKLGSLACEWVEHRDWVYRTEIPRTAFGESFQRRLHCLGLDGFGSVFFNGTSVGSFQNGYVPQEFDLAAVELRDSNTLELIFHDLPRFNGTPNVSSEIRELKARFNYSWDWMPRNVQIGLWDRAFIDLDPVPGTEDLVIRTQFDPATGCGRLDLQSHAVEPAMRLLVEITGLGEWEFAGAALQAGVHLDGLIVEPWQCNGRGEARLYAAQLKWIDMDGLVRAHREENLGFKQVRWLPCANAPAEADPWICELNGTPVFLLGVNWTPLRAHYADVSEDDYRLRLQNYKTMGMNVLRVWGGAFLEKAVFYRLCDELGLMVWQEFPLSSSGPDNAPPSDEETVAVFGEIARSYVRRRRHHVSLILWCGGNELQCAPDGRHGIGVPLTEKHPMLACFASVCREEDPDRRYVPCSSSGPTFTADEANFGKGLHWDVHGPWRMPGKTEAEALAYWQRDDALFRSEAGAPGCSPMDILDEFYPGCDLLPVGVENVYWRRCSWWIDGEGFIAAHGRRPETIAEYVTWSQDHQARAILLALEASRNRFPAMGGLIFWMGHDSFPCLSNTSLLDFHGRPKPAAAAIAAWMQAQI